MIVLSDLLLKLIPKSIDAINMINMQNGAMGKRTNRELNALVYKIGGHTVYKDYYGNTISGEDKIVILPKGSTYTYRCQETGGCILIEFDTDDNTFQKIISFKINNTKDILNTIYDMEHIWTLKKSGYYQYCLSGFHKLVYYILQSESVSYQNSTKIDLIKQSVTFIESNYNNPEICSQIAAKQSGISEVYFRKIFTSVFGISPKKYINSMRMTKAKEYLIGDYISIQDIAIAVGYTNAYHFCKSFKNTTGFTPTQYAESVKER